MDLHPTDIYRTLVLFKLDAIARRLVGKILSRFERRGLLVIGIKSVWPTKDRLAEHYIEHQDQPYYTDLIMRMEGRQLIACVLEGPDAVRSARAQAGATFDALAGTIRGDFGFNRSIENLVHTSDALDSADREIELWFADTELNLNEG